MATSASAASITHESFSFEKHQAKTAKAAAFENFDDPSTLNYTFAGGTPGSRSASKSYGEIAGSIGTSVGTFRTHGSGVGSGSTCARFSSAGTRSCNSIALQDERAINGQGNITSTKGGKALNSNDTLGMVWDVVLPGNKKFTSVVFAIRDAADAGASLAVSVNDGEATTFSKGTNNNRQLWEIVFDKPMSSAQILLANSKTNDAFTIDGAAVMVSAVPLPATGLMLLGAFGLTAGIARRRKAA
ncbi:hypothetical protein OCH239_20975 [Roseivivax halodurans JCM 10272]|uniref:PEP-CTERM protein-sorting domain-containing protein n=2 Tax=Roseivivax halodurans TaxID=93683 RepID=X7EI66_9RHOB|nr:hypothetical protein OCH239_20975 [Roseivivax halodurans JCM 10272]